MALRPSILGRSSVGISSTVRATIWSTVHFGSEQEIGMTQAGQVELDPENRKQQQPTSQLIPCAHSNYSRPTQGAGCHRSSLPPWRPGPWPANPSPFSAEPCKVCSGGRSGISANQVIGKGQHALVRPKGRLSAGLGKVRALLSDSDFFAGVKGGDDRV